MDYILRNVEPELAHEFLRMALKGLKYPPDSLFGCQSAITGHEYGIRVTEKSIIVRKESCEKNSGS